MAFIQLYTDRTRITTKWKCPRRRFYHSEYGGRGISSKSGVFEWEIGTIVHDALESFATAWVQGHRGPGVVDEIAVLAGKRALDLVWDGGGPDKKAREWATWCEGIFRAFCRHKWPEMMRDYTIVAVEPECVLKYGTDPEMHFMSRPDLLLRDNHDGTVWYWEYKTTASFRDKWFNSWKRAVQLHSGLLAAENTVGVELAGAIVFGLFKGYKNQRDGSLSSTLVYAYLNSGTPGVVPDQWDYEYRRGKGWYKSPTWEYPGGIKQWVEDLPEQALSALLGETAPITLDRQAAGNFMAQEYASESRIYRAKQQLMACADRFDVGEDPAQIKAEIDRVMVDVFPQHFDQCEPSFGSNCQFLDCCWSEVVNRDPLASGRFQYRTPHHEPELEAMNNARGVDEHDV